jgi:hypothetical protein
MNEPNTHLTRLDIQKYIDDFHTYLDREFSISPLNTYKEDSFEFREISTYNTNPYFVMYLCDYDIHMKIKFENCGVYYELERNDSYIEHTHPYSDNHEARVAFFFRIVREFINLRDMTCMFVETSPPLKDRIKTFLTTLV